MASIGDTVGDDQTEKTKDPVPVAVEAVEVVAVTAAIYKNGHDKPSERWCFEMTLSKQDSVLTGLLARIRKGYRILEKCKELAIHEFKINILNKDFTSSPEFPKGRVYSIDSQAAWEVSMDKL